MVNLPPIVLRQQCGWIMFIHLCCTHCICMVSHTECSFVFWHWKFGYSCCI